MSPIVDPRFSQARFEGAREAELKDSRRVARWEYLKPLIMLLIGATIGASVAAAGAADETGQAPAAVGFYFLFLAVSAVAGLVGLVAACALTGNDAGLLHLAFLRLLGIYAVMSVLLLVLAVGGCWGLLACGLIMSGLIAWLFEMDVADGLIVAVVTWLAWLGVFYFLQNAVI